MSPFILEVEDKVGAYNAEIKLIYRISVYNKPHQEEYK